MSGCQDTDACKCDELISRIEKIEKYIIANAKGRSPEVPHMCPICEGFKEVYIEDLSRGEADNYRLIPCEACKATGIVWK